MAAESKKPMKNARIMAGMASRMFGRVTLLKSGLKRKYKMIQMGISPIMVRALNAMLLTSAFVSMGWIGRTNSPERRAILDFVAKGVNDDVAGDLVNDQTVSCSRW